MPVLRVRTHAETIRHSRIISDRKLIPLSGAPKGRAITERRDGEQHACTSIATEGLKRRAVCCVCVEAMTLKTWMIALRTGATVSRAAGHP